MKITRATTALLLGLAAALAACEANPPLSPGAGLSVELSYTPDHVHILQSEVTFTVTVRDEHGEAVTDFEALAVERRLEGSDAWREIEMQLAGDHYEGTYTFASSGEYEMRVVGQLPGQSQPMELYHAPQHMHVARAHAEAGGYRVEFETSPGHIHEGEEATLTFWVMEAQEDATGNRPPVSGLSAEAHVMPEGGAGTLAEAHEHDPGVYEAHVTFGAAGHTHAGLHFSGSDGQPAEASYDLHVAHGH